MGPTLDMPTLRFYTTSGCTLCEQRLAQLKPIAKRLNYPLEVIDIMDDLSAEKAYAESIPVLVRSDRKTPLSGAFDAAAIYRFLT
jgi:hypothetical protein